MQNTHPPQLADELLRRLAAVYLRQSSERQVEQNVGSTQHQRNQREYALNLGYPEEGIVEIDEDLGLSGRTTSHRAGFQRLLKLVERREVGVIFVSDLSRLSRSTRDFDMLLALCRATGTLIAINGIIIDLEKHVYRLLAKIQSCLAEHENDDRTARFMDAKRALASKNYAVHRPPTGYMKIGKGQWGKDPDAQVRQVIDMVFREFERLGSAGKLLRFLAHNKLQMPIRTGAGLLRWVRPTRSRLCQILLNPTFAGYYVFGRKKYLPGTTTYRLTSQDDWILRQDHHEPYITPDAWRGNCERLRRNRFTVLQPAGSGPALVQGLIRCRCGSTMQVHYGGSSLCKTPDIQYLCIKAYAQYGAPMCCGGVDGKRLDAVVIHELLRSLAPPALQDVLEATQDINQGYHVAQQQRKAELQRVRDDAELAEARYKERDPRLRLVAVPLLEDWNQALERVKGFEQRDADDPLTPPLRVTDDVVEAICRLAEDLPALWSAPSTSNQDRKDLARHFVREVRVISSSKLDFGVEISWISGVTSHHHIFRVWAGGIIARELATQGWDAAAITAELNRRRVTPRGAEKLYSVERVRKMLSYRPKKPQASTAKGEGSTNVMD